MRLIRRVTFSSGHRYWFDHLSADENKALFGPWTSPYNHGHNYVLDVSADGVVDPEQGMVVNIKDIDAVLKQLNALRGQGGTVAAPAPAPVAAEVTRRTSPPTPAPPPPQVAPANPPPNVGGYATAPTTLAETPAVAGDLESIWSQLVDAAGRASPFVRTYLVEAHPVSFEKGTFVIGFDAEFDDHRGLVDNARNHTLLQTKLAELGHPSTQIKFIKHEAAAGRKPAATPAPAPAAVAPSPSAPKSAPATTAKPAAPVADKKATVPFNKDDFKNDPLIQKALEVFKGQIVEVRA